MTESRKLAKTVINNGYCIGCGACSSVKETPFKVTLNSKGNLVASFIEDELDKSKAKVLKVCPFSESADNEDEISDQIFNSLTLKDEKIGKYIACYAGHVNNDFRKKGSSGGFGKWIGYVLLENNEIDHFIQLKPNESNNGNELLFSYAVFSNKESVIEGAKSAYYPTTLEGIVDIMKNIEGRYAITGVPCNIKALRLLSQNNEIIKKRLLYTIGIICGGMKNANQSKMIGWQLGIHPDNLVGIDFRRKYENRPADQKIYQVWSNFDNVERFKDSSKIYGTDYGSGFFKPKACDYCDDVVSETADISIGDAWINKYERDPKGNSLLIVRNKKINNLLEEYNEKGSIKLDIVSAEDAANAQAGGFRHRREGLSYRLAKRIEEGEWVPIKRVKPNEFEITEKRKLVYDLREQIAEKSQVSFENALKKDDLNVFYEEMAPIVNKYKNLFEVSQIRLFLRKMKRIFIYDILKKY